MSATSSEIRVRALPRITAVQAAVLAGLLVIALVGGVVLGRATSSGTAPAKAAAAESVVSTAWLDDTPEFRQQIMETMNGLGVGHAGAVETAGVQEQVMRHMNQLSSAAARTDDLDPWLIRWMSQEIAPRRR